MDNTKKKFLFICGSLRRESVNKKLLHAFEDEIGKNGVVAWADINLPLFNEDLEESYPEEAKNLKAMIEEADVVVIATPEYNRGTSGALKNAIDWASRPYKQSSWKGKEVFVVSASPGGIGGALALYETKKTLLHLGSNVLGQPEFVVGGAFGKFDDKGTLIDEKTRANITKAVEMITG